MGLFSPNGHIGFAAFFFAVVIEGGLGQDAQDHAIVSVEFTPSGILSL